MLVRIFDDNTVKVLQGIDPEFEDEYIELNPNLNLKKVDSLPDSRFGFYKYDPDTDQIVVDTDREIAKYKQVLISRYKELVEEYILENYPYDKQQADIHQKDYYGTAILMIRTSTDSSTPITIDQIYIEVGNAANKILDGESTLQDIVSQYPEEEQFYWEQLIKAAARKAWTVRCTYVYNQYVTQVQNATTLEELDELDIQTLPFPEFPTF